MTFALLFVHSRLKIDLLKFLYFSYETQSKEIFLYISRGLFLTIKWMNSVIIGNFLFLRFLHYSYESKRSFANLIWQ